MLIAQALNTNHDCYLLPIRRQEMYPRILLFFKIFDHSDNFQGIFKFSIFE